MEKGLLAQALVEDVIDMVTKPSVIYLVYDKRYLTKILDGLVGITINKNDAIDLVIHFVYLRTISFTQDMAEMIRVSLQKDDRYKHGNDYIYIKRVPLGVDLSE